MNDRKGSYTTQDYRYGYNGKENDNEVKGESNQQDYGFRVYDPRVGRFLSVDPLTQSYPFYSLYQFAGNMPIWAGDVDGLEPNLEHCEDGINSYYSVNPRDISIDRTSPVNFGKGGFVFFPVSLGSKSIGWLASAKYSEEEFKNDTYGYQGDNSNTSGQFYDDAYIIRHDNLKQFIEHENIYSEKSKSTRSLLNSYINYDAAWGEVEGTWKDPRTFLSWHAESLSTAYFFYWRTVRKKFASLLLEKLRIDLTQIRGQFHKLLTNKWHYRRQCQEAD